MIDLMPYPGRPLNTLRRHRPLNLALANVVHSEMVSSSTADVNWVAVSTSASANTMGGWVELVASTTTDTDVVRLFSSATHLTSNVNSALAQIGVGGAGSEVEVATVAVGGGSNAVTVLPSIVDIPIWIPRGSRISVRWQSSRTSAGDGSFAVRLSAFPASLGLRSPSAVEAIGVDLGTSKGVDLSNTSGVWSEIISATPRAYQGFVISATSRDGTMTNRRIGLSLGVGTSGAEVAVGQPIIGLTGSDESVVFYGTTYVPVECPAETRIAVKEVDNQISTNSGLSVVVLGVPYS